MLALPGVVQELDQVAHEFVKANMNDYSTKIEEAETVVQRIKEKTKLENAKKYISIMKKISSRGLEYIEEEMKRIQKMMKEKLREPKKKSFEIKLNILKSFQFAVSKKDEL